MHPKKEILSLWFEDEIKCFENELRAFLLKKVPQGVEVDDIVQEAYRRVIRLKQLDEIKYPRGLLFTIAKHVLSDIFRKKYHSKTDFLPDMDELCDVVGESNPKEQLLHSDEQTLLQEALRTLPKKCRVIFVLHHIDRLSYKQIGERLGISSHTVQTQLKIGMRKCRHYFQTRGLI